MNHTRFPSDKAGHSDFLIHWTGKDIDKGTQWSEEPRKRSLTSDAETSSYIQRLREILEYGLWMTEEGQPESITVGKTTTAIPPVPRCCFTELKLSDSRRHASEYGRLGIGVKRKFLFDRFGRPLAYVGFGSQTNDKLFEACASGAADPSVLSFFKPMNTDPTNLIYELYDESEWRMLYFKQLEDAGRIVDPRKSANKREYDYFKALPEETQHKLKYLVPLDGWFAMIIYPSLAVKNRAQWDDENGIRGQIRRIKEANEHPNRVEGYKDKPPGNWPIEVNLDACRHF